MDWVVGLRFFSNEHYKDKIEDMLSREQAGWESTYLEVQCYRLDTLFSKHGITRVDFLALSTEGHEMVALQSIKWDAVEIYLIMVTVNEHTADSIDAFLRSKGFEHKALGMDGRDRMYVSHAVPAEP